MKKIFYSLAIVFLSLNLSAQKIGDLNGIYYQAVAVDENGKEIVGMDVEGKPLYNKAISVRFTITKGLNGTVQWEETHTTTTDKYGLFSLTIGQGQLQSSSYNRMLDIPWIDADQFLKVEISTKNDGNYKLVSNQKFMAVPFSFYTDDIADDAITTDKILDNEVLNQDVATAAINSRTIENETIITEDISNGAVTTDKILDNTIINQDVATAAVNSRTIEDETIITEDIANGAVVSEKILDNTIQNQDIDTASVNSRTIEDETIITQDIANGAVTTEKLLDNTIINEDIATGSVDSRSILDGSVDNQDIADGTIELTTKVTGILPVANGGTGVSSATVSDGQLLIGDGASGNFQVSNLSAGTGIVITNTPGGITISSPPVSAETNSDGSFQIPVGSNGVISGGAAWYSPNSLKISPPVDKPFEMGDIFLASANVDLKGCILSVYLQSVDGDGKANVQVILYNPQNSSVTLQTPVTFKFLVVK